MTTYLRYVSDLHLEFIKNFKNLKQLQYLWNLNKNPEDKYYLALVGDIGNPTKPNLEEFLSLLSPQYEKIYYVPGNHEYYNLGSEERTKDSIDSLLKEICGRFPNVKYFNNQVDYIGDVKIIGTTLWTKISDGMARRIKNNINDYHLIKKSKKEDVMTITVGDTNLWNRESLEFLKKEIPESEKCIILTHHAPLYNDDENLLYTAAPMYSDSENNEAFHNDLSEMIKPPIMAWIFGHTHYVTTFEYNGVVIATNQLGYDGESTYYTFNAETQIVIQ